MSLFTADNYDYKAARIRLEKGLSDGRPDLLNKRVLVNQDAGDFYFMIDEGKDDLTPFQMTFPAPVDNWDIEGAILAREWFYKEFAQRFPHVQAFFPDTQAVA